MSHNQPISWPRAVLIAIDQLGNAIAGGNPDSTISARTYYFSRVQANIFTFYWRLLEGLIDFTFKPIDGPQHCKEAYEHEPNKVFYLATDLARGILGILVIIVCLPLSILLRLAVLIIPGWRYQPPVPESESGIQP